MRVAGQLRFAPGGAVIGIDMGLAISLTGALGYDTAVVADLLPEAEAELVKTLNERLPEGEPQA